MLIAEVAKRGAIPRKFLESILLDLKRHGILDSRKGRHGGYSLRRPPHDISVADVIHALDGSVALVPCVNEIAYGRCDDCVDEAVCGIRLVMREVRDATIRILRISTLAGIVDAAGAATGRRL